MRTNNYVVPTGGKRLRAGSVVGVGIATTAAVLIGFVGGTTAQAQPAPPASPTVVAEDISVIYLDAEAIEAANSLAAERGEEGLPAEVQSVIVAPEGIFAADSAGNPVQLLENPFDTAWKVTKCIAFITVAVLPGTAAFRAIRGLGGIAQAARLLVQAGSAAEFRAVAGNVAAEIIGIAGIQNNCF